MVKRILSIALCLTMALSIVAPVVNAADDSAVSFDNVTFSDVTVDGETVNSTTSVTTPTQLGSTTTSTGTVSETAPDCDCGNTGKDIIVHSDSCLLKKYYQGICKQSSLVIWGMWSDLSTDAREYILAYLSWTDNAKLVELENRLSTGAFAEDSITVDGTEITAVNVPEYGSLQATTPSSSAQTAVNDYVASLGDSSAEPLFMWDISIKNISGQEWQPDGTAVDLELNVPGVKLHKYATVYVVHVDDAGNASKLPAQVTADGKIAFSTTSFSTFAAFTVDFAFNGAEFSIPGETSIKLSEVFDQLKMPLFVEDVANVVFSDTSLVTVEKQSDSDWLLTSLVEFHTDEKLTVTMVGGEVYVIDVTDATYVTISYNNSGNLDGGTLGVVEWYLHDSSAGGKAYSTQYGSYSAPGWTEDYDIYINGTNATDKNFEIVLQRHGYASGRTLYVDLHTIWIKGGANLIFRLGSSITKDNTDQIIVRQVRGYHDDTYGDEWWFGEMFWVENGSLELRVPYTAVDKGGDGGNVHEGVQMVFDWDSGNNNVPSGNGPKALVSLRQDATSFKANQCVFQNTLEAAIVCRSDGLSEFTMTSCEFKDTNKSGGNGSGIYLMSNVADSKAGYTLIHNFNLTDCTFSNCTAGSNGGAVSLRGYVHNGSISGCTFTDCTSGSYGGAVELAGNMGSFSISNSTFTNCTSTQRGGAVAIRSVEIKNSSDVPRWTRSNAITFSGCTFTNCDATSNHGGGIGAQAQIHTLTVSDCDFEDCDTNGANGGGISIDGADLPDTFKDSSVTNYPDWTAEISSCTTCAENNHDLGTVMGGSYDWKDKLDASKTVMHKSWVNTVNITNGCTFDNCTAISNGGSIEFAEGCYITNSATISGATISNSKAVNEGSAIFWSTCFVKSMSLTSSIFENCSFTGTSTNAGGTVKVTGKSTLVLSVEGCIFRYNTSHHHGGGLYWNANRNLDGVVCKATVHDCQFEYNTAAEYGGGIYVESDIAITKCNIRYNTAGLLGGGIAQQVYNNPGARMLDEGGVSELKLDPQTWVHHNTATNGGGISIRANATGSITNRDPETDQPFSYTVRFELNGAAVYENTATGNGGGIYFIAEKYDDAGNQFEVDGYTKVILINAGTGTAAAVYKNTAANNGGGIYMDSSNNTELRIQGGYISSNKADSDGDNTGNGGGIYMTGKNATCYVEGGTIGGEGNDSNGDALSNTAICGGGIAISGGAKIEMTDGEISYNNVGTASAANRQGGGIWLDAIGENKVANTMTLSGGTVKYNSTPGGNNSHGGGVFVGSNGNFEIKDGYIQHNSAGTANGGGLFSYMAIVKVNGGTIGNNSATNGGGIYADYSTMTIDGGYIQNNEATNRGGGIYNGYANLTIGGGYIQENEAKDGAGIFVYCGVNWLPTVTLNDGYIQKNTAAENGGAVYSYGGKVVINGGTITENTATQYGGGAIFATVRSSCGHAADVTVSGGEITKNVAGTMGGGIAAQNSATVTVNGGSITYNKAYNSKTETYGNGGGIYAESSATVKVGAVGDAHGTISYNEASNGGGVYVVSGADLTIDSGYLTYNKAYGKPDSSIKSAYQRCTALMGTGGGVFLARGTADNSSTFTLTGDTYAIYGNLADFAADDVFANGEYTKLTVPKVADMDLSEYKFKPEGWFEDYPANDSQYTSGLALAASGTGITNGNVFRYRGSDPLQRVQINDNNNIIEDTDENTKQVNDANVYVCMTLGMPTAVNDTVVIDYGKPVDIHVLINEIMNVANAELQGIGPLFNHVEGVYGYESLASGYGNSYAPGFGSVTADLTNGVVRFSLNTMAMTKEVAFSYAVKYTNSEDSSGNAEYFYYYADVTVIPATSIYYEDDFGSISYGAYDAAGNKLTTGGWEDAVANYTDSTVQDEDRPGAALENSIDKDNVYGYDSHYKSGLMYSLGNAQKVTVNSSKYATATFTFKGTGFDVISMTSNTTGTIVIEVDDLSKGVDDEGNPVEGKLTYYIVDTYYGYKLVNGEWVVDPNADDALYQIPVMKLQMPAYGEYKITITATYASFFDHQKDGSYDFYLDAIRIYDSANNGVNDDGTVNSVVQGAYKDDGEGWPSYEELRNKLIDSNTFNQNTAVDIDGVVFIDGQPLNKDVTDYKNYGPNNELYLGNGQAVAFTLDNPATLAGVQIAMKSVGTSSVPVKISYYDSESNKLVTFKEFVDDATTTDMDESIATATDLYYDISDLAGKTVVIENTSTTAGSILSITNIKTTYTEQPSTFKLLRTRSTEIDGVLAALNAVEEQEQPDTENDTNTEQCPATGDTAMDTVVFVALAACVMMLAVLVIPNARKRIAQ